MTTSRSIGTPSRWLAAAAVLLLVWLAPGLAEARRRLVVLEFTGPKADEFQADVVKLLKKGNSVVPTRKWEAAADDLNATKVNERNVRKVARKLSVDGVISGRVEKRGSRYILHLQLREGRSGKTIAAPDIVERDEGLSIDGRNVIKDELLPIIDDLPPAGGDDEDEDEDFDEEEEEEPRAKAKGKTKGKGRTSGFGRGKVRGGDDEEEEEEDFDEEEEEEEPRARGKAKGKGKGKGKTKVADKGKSKGKGKGKGKARAFEDDEDEEEEDPDAEEDGGDEEDDDDRVAARGDDDEGGGDDEDDDDDGDGDADVAIGGKVNLTNPRRRAMDIAVGLSFTGRKLSFTTNLQMNRPQGYDGGPVPGLRIAADIYPLAFNPKNKGIKRNLGISIVVDRVLSISSNLEKMGTNYELPTTEHHLAGGIVYRHPVGKALQVEGSIRYNKRRFYIDRNNPNLVPGDVDIPNTNYTYIDPGLAVRYVLGPKMVLGGGGRFLLITDTGEMQSPMQYGGATVTGLDLEAGVDYEMAPKILLRVAGRLTTIGYAFAGNGELTNNRDGDPATTDVSGARDTYFGGFASGVYLF